MALDQLEATLKKQWRLGQSIFLCWAFDPNGLLTIVVPHNVGFAIELGGLPLALGMRNR